MKNLVIKVLKEIQLINQWLTRKEQEMILNNLIITGNLTKDPQKKQIPTGKEVCSFTIANNFIYSKNGEKVTEVSYFDVEAWGVVAENCFKFLSKGSGVIVEGRIRQEQWEKDGKHQSRVKITANAVHFLPRGQKRSSDSDLSITSNETGPTEMTTIPQEVVMVP